MNKISFKANINTNLKNIQTARIADKFFIEKVNGQKLDTVIQRVASLATMKENSIVSITPRLDNNILNLICKVRDENSIVETTINERSARRLVQDSNFSERFVQNVAKAIENVDKTKNCVLEINDYIKKSKTIKDEKFMCELPYYILKSFKNGTNPTKRLLSILKQIEIEYPNEINKISIKNFTNKYERYKQSRVNTYFCISNGQIDKKIPINYIMKDPVENLFI